MEKNLEQDIEIQLQEELNRLKKAVEYIEQAKASYAQSEQLYFDIQSSYVLMSKSFDNQKQSFNDCIAEIETKIKSYQLSIENRIEEHLQNNKERHDEDSSNNQIEGIITDLSNQITEIKLNIEEQNTQIAVLKKKIKRSKIFNYILFLLLIGALIFLKIKMFPK